MCCYFRVRAFACLNQSAKQKKWKAASLLFTFGVFLLLLLLFFGGREGGEPVQGTKFRHFVLGISMKVDTHYGLENDDLLFPGLRPWSVS